MGLHDFCGFTWRGEHSSDHGIVRVSDGSRYNDTILPAFQDTTQKMPGSDGTLYWESFYTNKTFSINIAFDHLTEDNYRKLRQWLNGKDRGELIFDEAPYKAYTVKLQSAPQLKTICFNEGNQRIYKGEGTIQFIAYYPYAKSVHKFLDDYTDYSNKDEWAPMSGMITISNQEGTSLIDIFDNNKIQLFNPGDVVTDFKLRIPVNGIEHLSAVKIEQAENQIAVLEFKTFIIPQLQIKNYDINKHQIRINSMTQLIEEIYDGKPTGKLFNQFIKAGDFFKIPLGNSTLFIVPEQGEQFTNVTIDYDYLYY